MRPPEAIGVSDLGDLGRGRFKLDHFAGFMIRCRHPILVRDDAAVVIFIVADDNFTGGRGVFTDNHGKAGLRRKADVGQKRADAYSKSGLFYKEVSSKRSSEKRVQSDKSLRYLHWKTSSLYFGVS